MLAKIIKQTDPEALSITTALLAEGGVAILPCDTIYGLVGIVPLAHEALRRLKGRQESKHFLQLATLDMIEERVKAPLDTNIIANWPGPLSVVLTEQNGTNTAFRVPADPFLTMLLTTLGTSLYSTSVNRSGQAQLDSLPEIVQEFSSHVDLIVEAENFQGRVASTLIDATVRPYRLLRAGAFDATVLIANSAL